MQPLNLDDTPRGAALLAVDGVGAGVHEKVLVVLEGRAAGEALGQEGRAGRRRDHRHHRSGRRSMEISDQELRAMVRDAIARHGRPAGIRATGSSDRLRSFASHASHGRFLVAGGSADDGRCLIEPAVRCNHCGYCQSLGH